VKYQVISGGDLDINFMIAGPDNKVYHMEYRKVANSVRFQSTQEGDYKVCFDNTFSRVSSKVVYFEVFLEDRDAGGDKGEAKLTFDGENITDQLDITVQQFVAILDRCKKNLDRSIEIQTVIRVHEAKDRNVQELNFFRVNLFSLLQLAVMMSVGLVQVISIQHLFSDKTTGSALKVILSMLSALATTSCQYFNVSTSHILSVFQCQS
jgi:protein ERP2